MSNLLNVSQNSPGNLGLFTEHYDNTMDLRWCSTANNAVIDGNNRLASRRGLTKYHTGDPLSTNVKALGAAEYTTSAGVTYFVVAADNYIYALAEGTKLWQTVSSGSVGSVDWEFRTLGDNLYGTKEGGSGILKWTGTGTATYPLGLTGTKIPPSFSNVLLTAYGRAWTTDANHKIVYYSNLLDPTIWSGYVDLSTVFASKNDYITHISAFNGMLVIFCRYSIIIYGGTRSGTGANTDFLSPDTMTLVDNIKDVGCIAPRSIAHTGDDIIFLSGSGVRSLSRTIIQKSLPLTDLSYPVHTDMFSYISADTTTYADINAVYHTTTGRYILSIPYANRAFVFHITKRTETGAPVITTWSHMVGATGAVEVNTPYTMITTKGGELLIWHNGSLYKYYGDITNRNDGTYSHFSFNYSSAWLDVGAIYPEVAGHHILPKQLILSFYSEYSPTMAIKWGTNFVSEKYSQIKTVASKSAASIFGVSLFGYDCSAPSVCTTTGLSRFSGLGGHDKVTIPLMGVGTTFKYSLETTVQGRIALQAVAYHFKEGSLEND